MKTLLIGNFGAKNLGDELILSSALDDYFDSIVMTSDSAYSQAFCEKSFETVPFFPTGFRSFFRFIFSSKYRQEICSLRKKVDKVVFPGGGLFAIKFRAVLLWFIIFCWVKILFKARDVIFEHQGIDHDFGWMSQKLIKFVFLKATKISVRDDNSKKAIHLFCGKNVENKGDRVEKKLIINNEQLTIKKEKIILINAISKFKYEKIKKIFRNYKKIFIAFQESDLRFIPYGFDGEVIFPKTKTELFDIFRKSQVAVGERLHFLILAFYFCGDKNTYILKVPYSGKVYNYSVNKGILMLKDKEIFD